jgi:D-3-phosphoglycerate dehydrogenase
MPRIFLTHTPDALKNYYGERAVAGLKAIAEVRLNSKNDVLTTAELIKAAHDCEIIISHRQTPGEAELFKNTPNLIAFSRCAVDIRNIDVAAASANGILITQASAGFIHAVAEWIISSMIVLGRKISTAAESYHVGKVPSAVMGIQLHGSTIGVIGYGQIGKRVCELALAFGMRVLVHDPYKKIDDSGIIQTDMTKLLAEADYVVPLAVATDETENLVNAEFLAGMKQSAFLINASRGNLIDETALEKALDQGRIAGCAMDVGRAADQMPTPTLAKHPKVIATPHSAGLTLPAIEHQSMETVAQAIEIVQGKAPKGSVNGDKATRLARFKS